MAAAEPGEDGSPVAQPVSVDAALECAGGAGRFQKAYLVALGFPWMLSAMMTYSVVFNTRETAWHFLGETGPPLEAQDKCQLARGAWAWDDPRLTTVAAFGLVCGRKSRVALLSTLFFFGAMLGLPVGGWWSDKRGRKEAFIVGTVILQVPAAMSVWLPSYEIYAAARFLFGFGQAVMDMTAFVLVTEVLGEQMASVPVWWMNSMFAIGQIAMSPLAMVMTHWRELNLAIAVLLATLLAVMCSLSESPKWLASQGRTSEAHKVLCRIAKVNKRPKPPPIAEPDLQITQKQQTAGVGVLCDRRLTVRFVVSCITWFCVSAAFYGLGLSAGSIPLSLYASNLLNGVVQVAGYVTGGYLIQRHWCGRKGAVVGGFLVGGACLLLSAFVRQKVVLLMFYYAGSFGVSTSFGVVFLYTAELFPTNVRGLALGINSLFARVGAMLSPYVAVAGSINHTLPPLIFGVMCLVAGGLQVLLPETRGVKLPDTVDDIGRVPAEDNSDASDSEADASSE